MRPRKVNQDVVEKGGSRTKPYDNGKRDRNELACGGLDRTGPKIGGEHD
jgi:hypothetical protein